MVIPDAPPPKVAALRVVIRVKLEGFIDGDTEVRTPILDQALETVSIHRFAKLNQLTIL